MAKQSFKLIGEQDVPQEGAQTAPTDQTAQATAILMLALRALGQRFVMALAALETLLMVVSVFWLAMSIKDPDTHQLIGIGMYALFILTVAYLKGR
jgi:Ca2+/H+ antiporter